MIIYFLSNLFKVCTVNFNEYIDIIIFINHILINVITLFLMNDLFITILEEIL
jgi:hypothetical protein